MNISTRINKILSKKLNIIFFFFLLVCFLSRLDTQFFIIDILGQLSFFVLISGILFFFILLILNRLRASIFCFLVCILLTLDISLSCNQCNSFLNDKSKNYNKIRLLIFNTGLIKDFKNMKELILFEKPDIIQFQEVSSEMQNKIKSLNYFFPYNTEINKSMHRFDSIIFSKYPLKNHPIEDEDNHAILTTLILNNSELNVAGIHLRNSLNQADYNLAIKGMEYLKTLVKNTNGNLIVIGDLNMTPTSKRFANFLRETNLYTYTSYKHPTFTWPAFLPSYFGIQIDHVLFSKNFKVIGKKTANHFGSDHRPLIVDLAY